MTIPVLLVAVLFLIVSCMHYSNDILTSSATSPSSSVLTSCDFNNSSKPFCNFHQDSDDNSDWTRNSGPTPTPGTGPNGGYPDGSE